MKDRTQKAERFTNTLEMCWLACLKQNFLLPTGKGKLQGHVIPKPTYKPQINLVCRIPMSKYGRCEIYNHWLQSFLDDLRISFT